jgi:hypothetical protein
MARSKHYVPALTRFTVRVLYYEAKRRHIPMTRLADELLTNSLQGTPGWRIAEEAEEDQQALQSQDQIKR